MEKLLKNWEKNMLAYRKEADESKSSIERIKAINKFFVYRDCIKELKEQLLINGVVASKRFTETDLSRAYQAGCLENVDECIKYSFKDLKELQQDSLEWIKRYTK